MGLMQKGFLLQLLGLVFLGSFLSCRAFTHRYEFVIEEVPYTRLCSTKTILTVNGQFPGPTLHLREGDTTFIHVVNKGNQNISIHWHGVKQPRYPWSDGPSYITQCPIMPGNSYTQKIRLSDEIGTLWYHAHSDWSRATVHGPIVVYPKFGHHYPFHFDTELPLVLGQWWKSEIQAVLSQFLQTGGDPNVSDALLINGQPGDLYPCSKQGTFKLAVEHGKTYLLRMVNAAMDNILFFAIAKHNLTVVAMDGAYTKYLNSEFIAIAPGRTMDVIFEANQTPDHYYMAGKIYNSAPPVRFDNSTTTGILEYKGNYTPSSPPIFPYLPAYNDTKSAAGFIGSVRSLANKTDVPLVVDKNFFFTFSINVRPCEANNTCAGPRGGRFATSINNISFIFPRIAILQAYYQGINGVYGDRFPNFPPLKFNFTSNNLSTALQLPTRDTEVKVLEYNTSVEIVLQGTNLVAGIDHPIHLHGHSFYVVGFGFGNFNKTEDPKRYNLKDPPLLNIVTIPRNGWTTIRFRTINPGVWLMHCHIERHITWGMAMAFVVRNGKGMNETLLPPPPTMPPC